MLPVSQCVRGVYFSRTRVDAVAAHKPHLHLPRCLRCCLHLCRPPPPPKSPPPGRLRRVRRLHIRRSSPELLHCRIFCHARMINRLPRVYVLRAAGRSGLDGSMDPSAREHRRHGAQVARSVPASRSTHFVKTRACIWTGRNTNKR
jgi:hypothetical protein